VSDLAAAGHDAETVKRIEKLLYLAEYKRRQSAPGVKVTRKNFGRDRRYPIVNKFRDPYGAEVPPSGLAWPRGGGAGESEA
jgi:NAD+ synthase